jgi:hypothetical protein
MCMAVLAYKPQLRWVSTLSNTVAMRKNLALCAFLSC